MFGKASHGSSLFHLHILLSFSSVSPQREELKFGNNIISWSFMDVRNVFPPQGNDSEMPSNVPVTHRFLLRGHRGEIGLTAMSGKSSNTWNR